MKRQLETKKVKAELRVLRNPRSQAARMALGKLARFTGKNILRGAKGVVRVAGTVAENLEKEERKSKMAQRMKMAKMRSMKRTRTKKRNTPTRKRRKR